MNVSKELTPPIRRRLSGGHDPSIGQSTQFPPGQSGNPSGRPKHGISTIYNKWLKKKRNRAKIEEFLDATIDADAKSRMAGVLQLERMADRTEGSVTQQLDMNVTGTIQLADTIEQRRKKRSDSKS